MIEFGLVWSKFGLDWLNLILYVKKKIIRFNLIQFL